MEDNWPFQNLGKICSSDSANLWNGIKTEEIGFILSCNWKMDVEHMYYPFLAFLF